MERWRRDRRGGRGYGKLLDILKHRRPAAYASVRVVARVSQLMHTTRYVIGHCTNDNTTRSVPVRCVAGSTRSSAPVLHPSQVGRQFPMRVH